MKWCLYMGTDIGALIQGKPVEVKDFSGKVIAVDAFNTLYQFMNVIKGKDGDYLRDSTGRVTSHYSGIFYRFMKLMEHGVKPVFVFDGNVPKFDGSFLREDDETYEMARMKWMGTNRYSGGESKVSTGIIEGSKRLLELMGIPYVVAPSEGEAQAAYMVRKGDADYVCSQDFDALLFGGCNVVRNLTISGKKKVPRSKMYKVVKPEVVSLKENLDELGINREQLIDIALCVGTDYNAGIAKIGAKRALKLVKKHGVIDVVLDELGKEIDRCEDKKKYFIEPVVTDNYVLEWKGVDEGIIDFLCYEHDFSRERVMKVLGE